MEFNFNALIFKSNKAVDHKILINSLMPSFVIEDEDEIELEDALDLNEDVYLDMFNIQGDEEKASIVFLPNFEFLDLFELNLENLGDFYAITFVSVIDYLAIRRFQKNANNIQLIFEDGKLKHEMGMGPFYGLHGKDAEEDLETIFRNQLGCSFYDLNLYMNGIRYYFEKSM